MVSSCPNCGVVTPPEARFCRHCGAPLRTGRTLGGNDTVSPLAQTVPLSGEGFTTSSLSTDETGRPAPETKRVGQAEIKHLLRHTRFESTPDSKNDGDGSATLNSDYAAPQTGELTEKTPATAAALAYSAERASAISRPRRLWPTMAVVLLLATLSAALLAYYFLRQRQPSNAVELTSEANSNQTTESVNTNTPAEQAGVSSVEPSPEETPQPSPAPSASVERTRDARVQQEQRESATATPAPAGASTPLTPTPTPVAAQTTPAQTAPSPQTTPATANSNNSVTQAAQASSDDFYFQAVNLVNGRHPRTMPRAELLRALQLFQNVRSGTHAADARRQAAQLVRELDRLNKQSQR
ncbi:MAG TPA: zinc ribbon domain-containing protein [Pyrinomonadaceae bacterium]